MKGSKKTKDRCTTVAFCSLSINRKTTTEMRVSIKAFLLVSATAVASTDAFSTLVTTRRSSFMTALQPRRSSYISQATPSSTSVEMVAGGAAAYEQEMYDGVYSNIDL